MSIASQGMSVQALYREYCQGNLLVNRRYQRKLVWFLEEKRLLIDSILNGYPIPLVLLAERTDVHPKGKYEILDGIQRFDAIFTFIENSFDYDGKYFDVNEFARAKQAAEDGRFTPVTDRPLLSPERCANFLDYHLAVTVYPTTDDSEITDVFGRINSRGRQLSPQHQRQAGVVSEFAKLVRTLASELRGDVSRDILVLSQMPEISVDSAREPHGYGIRAENTPWCRQGILSVKQLRESEDDQTVADIAASILTKKPLAASKELLDKLYDSATDEAIELQTLLAAYGPERLAGEIKSVFSVLMDIVERSSTAPKQLRAVVRPGKWYPIKTPFYALFMALFDLIVRQEKSPDQPDKIMDALEGLDARLKKGGHYETTEKRAANISLTKGLIQDYFVARVPPVLGHGPSLAIDFENALRRSRIETPRYEFKQGILRLDETRQLDDDLLLRLVRTACGIANLGPDSDGHIFVGVADREAHADRIEQLDGVPKRKVADHFLVGIEREAEILGVSVEDYVRRIVHIFQEADMTDPLKTHILSSLDVITLHQLTFVRIRIPAQPQVSFVNEKAYSREGSSTVEIEGPRLVAVSKLFDE